MRPGAVLLLLSGGTVAVLALRRGYSAEVVYGPGLAALARPGALRRLGGGGAVTRGRPEPGPLNDLAGYGRGLPPVIDSPASAIPAADPTINFSSAGGGDLGVGTPGVSGAAAIANTAPSEFSYAQFAASRVAPTLPGVPALVALMTGNPVGFIANALANLIGYLADLSNQAQATLATRGVETFSFARTALAFLGIAVPTLPAVPIAGTLARASIEVGQRSAEAELSARLSEAARQGIVDPVELDVVMEIQQRMIENPELVTIALDPRVSPEIAAFAFANPTAPGVTAPPGTHAIPGHQGFFTNFTLTPVDALGRPYGAATGNPTPNSTNFGQRGAAPDPDTAPPVVDFDIPEPDVPGLPAPTGTPQGLPEGLAPAPPTEADVTAPDTGQVAPTPEGEVTAPDTGNVSPPAPTEGEVTAPDTGNVGGTGTGGGGGVGAGGGGDSGPGGEGP